MLFSPFKKYKNELTRLYRIVEQREDELDKVRGDSLKAERAEQLLDEATKSLDNFIENSYAEAVFQYYSEIQPELIRIHTGEELSWLDAFGSDFKAVSKSLRHSLVGLVEDPGRYRLK